MCDNYDTEYDILYIENIIGRSEMIDNREFTEKLKHVIKF